MLKLLEGFPDNVVACAAEGEVTRQDYEVLVPKIEEALKHHARIRCYYELGSAFQGFEAAAAWEDFKLGVEHLSRWERMAVVTDVAWVRLAMLAFRFLLPGQLRVFAANQTSHARAWIMARETEAAA
jgi:SpoIIAA-like